MVQIQFKSPEPLNFKAPEDWPCWKQHFEQFCVISGLVDETAKKQVITLLYCLGEEGETLVSTNITEEHREVYDIVINKFDWLFKVTRNVISEHVHFNCWVQLEGETAKHFIIELYNLSEFCNYRELTSEMIHDRLVKGIHDHHLSERLQLDSELNWKRPKRRSVNTKLYRVSRTCSKEPQ